jgi:hypothetical protein
MTYTAHFHDGPWDGESRALDGDAPGAEIFVPDYVAPTDDVADLGEELTEELTENPSPRREPRYEQQPGDLTNYLWTT